MLPACVGGQWQGSQTNEKEGFYCSNPPPTSTDPMGSLFREIIQQNPSNPPLHPPGYPQLFVLLCFPLGRFPASWPLTGPWSVMWVPATVHREKPGSSGTGTNKLRHSELKYVPACLNINIKKASESINYLHAMYHTWGLAVRIRSVLWIALHTQAGSPHSSGSTVLHKWPLWLQWKCLYFPSWRKPMALSTPSSLQLALLCQFKGSK